MTAIAEGGITRGEPKPIPIEEEKVKRMLYDRIWEAKFGTAKRGWTRLFRVDNDTGEGYVYPDDKDGEDHLGYGFDKGKLEQIWANLVASFRISLRDGYFYGYDEKSEQSTQTGIFPTLALPNEPYLVFKSVSEVYSTEAAFLLQKAGVISQEWMVQRLNPQKWKRKEYR